VGEVMGRVAKHNWKKLFLEYNQGRYKSVAEFAKKKGIYPDRMRKEFRKLESEADKLQVKTSQENESEQVKKNDSKEPVSQKQVKKSHPWQNLKKQFTDWPEEKLQAYVVQIESRLAELKAIPDEELTTEEMKEIGKLRRERRVILSDPDPEHICTSHNKDGSSCKNPVERGKKTCWVHGGAPGSGAPKGSRNALRHGFYSRILPDDEEMRDIIAEIDAKSPIDMIWEQIVLQYGQIARAQKLMYVRDQADIVKHLKKQKDGESFTEREWEFQYPWDRHAAFLTAQSKAMITLERLIVRYEAMANDEQKLKLEKLKQDMEIDRERLQLEKSKVLGDPDETEDDGFIDALQGKVGEAWDDHSDSEENQD
jgi:hypothetical protein